jgi:hypothetical protein
MCPTILIRRIDHVELEAIGRQILESTLEIKRLDRAVRVFARPDLGRNALPVPEQDLLDRRDVSFHDICFRLIVGRLRGGCIEPCDHQDQ